MNPRLRRLTIAFSLTCFLGFGTWSSLSYYHYRGWDSFLEQEAREATKMQAMCVDKAAPSYQKWLVCGSAKEHQATLAENRPIQYGVLADAYTGLWLAIGLPCAAFFLLYVGTWVMVGKLRSRPE